MIKRLWHELLYQITKLISVKNDLEYTQKITQVEVNKAKIMSKPIEVKGNKMKLSTIAFCGKNTKRLDKITDEIVSIPAINTSRIQEMHITIGQMLCNAIENDLKLSHFVKSET